MTTDEMDGIFKEEDSKNRYAVVLQCKACKNWMLHQNWLPGNAKTNRCDCGANNYDRRSIKSIRTYNPIIDRKRKTK